MENNVSNKTLIKKNIFIVIIFFSILLSLDIFIGKISILPVTIPLLTVSLIIILVTFFLKNTWIPLIILTIPIRDICFANFGNAHIRIGDMLILLVAFFWFTRKIATGSKIKIVRNKLDMLILFFIFINIISILWSTNLGDGAVRILKFLRNGMLFFLLREFLIKDFNKQYVKIVILFLITGFMVSIVPLCDIYEFGGAIRSIQFLRAAESLPSSSLALSLAKRSKSGGIFMLGISSWLAMCTFMGIGLMPQIKKNGIYILNLLLIFIMIGLIGFSCDRATWVGFAGGMLMFFITIFGDLYKKQKFYLLLILFCIVVFLYFSGFVEIIDMRISPKVLSDDPSVLIRLNLYRLAIADFLRHPLFGAGVSGITPLSRYGNPLVTHNLYLQILGELGAIGFIIFSCLLYLWLNYLIKLLKRFSYISDKKNKFISASIFGATVCYLTTCLAGQDFEDMIPWILLSITSALFTEFRTHKAINF